MAVGAADLGDVELLGDDEGAHRGDGLDGDEQSGGDDASSISAAESLMRSSLQLLAAPAAAPALTVHQVLLVADVIAQRPEECAAVIGYVACRAFPPPDQAGAEKNPSPPADGRVSIGDQLKDAKGDQRRCLLKLCAVANTHLAQQLEAAPNSAELKALLTSTRAFAGAVHRGIDYDTLASPVQLAVTLGAYTQCGLTLTKGVVGTFARAISRALRDDAAVPNMPTIRRVGDLLPGIARVDRARAKAILTALIGRVDKAAGDSAKAAAFRSLAPTIRMAGRPSLYPAGAMLHTAAVAETAQSYAAGRIHIDAAVDAIKLACAVAGPDAVRAVGPLAKLLPDNPELLVIFEGESAPAAPVEAAAPPDDAQPMAAGSANAAAAAAANEEPPREPDTKASAEKASATATAAEEATTVEAEVASVAADHVAAATPIANANATSATADSTEAAVATEASAADSESVVYKAATEIDETPTGHASASTAAKECPLTRLLQLSLQAAGNGAGGLLSDNDTDELLALMVGTAATTAGLASGGGDGEGQEDSAEPSSAKLDIPAMQWGPKLAPVLAVIPAERRGAFLAALFDTQPALRQAQPELGETKRENDDGAEVSDIEYVQGIEGIAKLHCQVKEAAHGRSTLSALFNAHKKTKIAPADIDAVDLAGRIRAGLPPREIASLWTQTVAPATATVARTSPLLIAIVLALTPATTAPATTTTSDVAAAATSSTDETLRPVVEELDAANLLEALCVVRGARGALMKLREELRVTSASDEVAAEEPEGEDSTTAPTVPSAATEAADAETDPVDAANALDVRRAHLDRMLDACASSEAALTAAVRAVPDDRFASAKVCVLRLPTLGVAMASYLIERIAATLTFNDLVSTLHFLSNVISIVAPSPVPGSEGEQLSPGDAPSTATATISETALERVGARACVLLNGATADEIGAALHPIARIAEWQQARQLRTAAKGEAAPLAETDKGTAEPAAAEEEDDDSPDADTVALSEDDREKVIAQCSFVRTLRAILRVDEITDRATLQKFLSRRAPPTALIGPELERVLLPLIPSWSLFDVLGATRDLRTKHQLTTRIAVALWERATSLVFADGDDNRQARASVLTLAKTFADVGQLTGERGLEIATRVSSAIESYEGADASATFAELDALGVKPASALYRRLSQFHDKNRIAHLRSAMEDHAILSTSEVLDLITLYCHDQSTAGSRAGPVDGFARLVAAYTHLATQLQTAVDASAAAAADGADAAAGGQGTSAAAMTSAEGSEFTRLLQALSRSGEWPDVARTFVQARLNTQLQGMDSRALTNNLRAIAKDPALRDAYAPTMLERVLDTAHFLDLEEASVAAIGVAELDAEVNDLVLAAHDALCTRFVELLPRAAGGGGTGGSAASEMGGPKRVVLLRFLEAMSVHGADWSALQALQGQLRRHARHLDGRHAATALQHLSKLYRPGVEPSLLLDLMHAVEADGSVQHMAVALVAAAEVPLALSDQIERMFGRVMFVRDVYVNNPTLRAGLDVAAREYAPRLPTRITHAFVRASSRHASDQWEGMEW